MVAILSHISGKVVQYYIIYLIIYVPFGKLSNEKVIIEITIINSY